MRSAGSLAAILALSACGGNHLQSNAIPGFSAQPGQKVQAKITIAGVGDSLTAGVQSAGLLGAQVPGGASAGTFGTIGNVQETQEHGFFAVLWEQANGVPQSALENPTTSPLPLIGAPGLGGTLAKTTSGFPVSIASQCGAQGASAFSVGGALALRLNPSVTPYDVGVPAITVHEAVAMFQPLTSCASIAGTTDPTQQALGGLVLNESQFFYPVLGNFGSQVTMLQAASSLHAQLATVWLGANDIEHFLDANGAAPAADATSVGNDVTTIIRTLQGAGSKVAVATVLDPLSASMYFPQPIYATALQAGVAQAIVAQVAASNGISVTAAQALCATAGSPCALQIAAAQAAAAQYAQAEAAQVGLGPNGYFTLATFFATLGAVLQQQPVPVLAPQGSFISDAVAQQAHALTTAYNAAITAAAKTTGAALVDIFSVLASLQASTAKGQPFLLPGSTGAFVSLAYGGGATSLDGFHPSNTMYAAIANLFIQAFDATYGLAIPPVNLDPIYAADPYAPQNFPNPFVPLSAYVRAGR